MAEKDSSEKMNLKSIFIHISSLIFIIAPVSISWAGKAIDQIQETSDRILLILDDTSLKGPKNEAKRNRMIKELVNERFDWEEFSKRALAKHWRGQTIEDKKEFISLFGTLLERTYHDKVTNHSVAKVIYDEEELDGKYGLVRIRVLTHEKKEYPVTYKVILKGDDWFIYDISIKGISLVNNYRVQFRDILRKSSFQELLVRLRKKLK
jgi:phospholipid transport system substrate-binding protein